MHIKALIIDLDSVHFPNRLHVVSLIDRHLSQSFYLLCHVYQSQGLTATNQYHLLVRARAKTGCTAEASSYGVDILRLATTTVILLA